MAQGPERTCIGCGRKRPKRELVRLVVGAEGRAAVVDTAQKRSGRGAYLCGPGCLAPAVKRKALVRSFRGGLKVAVVEGW